MQVPAGCSKAAQPLHAGGIGASAVDPVKDCHLPEHLCAGLQCQQAAGLLQGQGRWVVIKITE